MIFKVWVFWVVSGLLLNDLRIQHAINQIQKECGTDFEVDTVMSSDSLNGSYDTIVGITLSTPSNITALCAEQVLDRQVSYMIWAMTVKQH